MCLKKQHLFTDAVNKSPSKHTFIKLFVSNWLKNGIAKAQCRHEFNLFNQLQIIFLINPHFKKNKPSENGSPQLQGMKKNETRASERI